MEPMNDGAVDRLCIDGKLESEEPDGTPGLPDMNMRTLQILGCVAFCSQGHAQPTLGVCEAIGKVDGASTARRIRGVGAFQRGEFVLFDFTCPIAKSKSRRVPSMIVVAGANAYGSADVRESWARGRDRGNKGYIQAVVSGRLRCKKLKVEFNQDGEFIAGSGFGASQMGACVIENALVEDFVLVEDQ